jgi:protein TonB
LRVRAALLAVVVVAHGLAAFAALHVRVSPPEIVPPGVLQVRWIAGEPSGLPGPPAVSGEPEVAAEPPDPEPDPIVESPIIPEALAAPEAPVVPPPPPPKKPRPVKPPPKPPRPQPPKPAETPPAEVAPAPSSGVSDAASTAGPSAEASAASTPATGAGRNADAGRNTGGQSDYVGPAYRAAYLSNPPPHYPPASRRMGEEGRVALRVHITADGRADEILLHQGSGFERLDRAAIEAVRRWRFIPARRDRENVPGWVVIPIQFSLES